MSQEPKTTYRSNQFSLRELRLMVSAFRSCQLQSLLAEFETALDARIKQKLIFEGWTEIEENPDGTHS